MAEDAAVTRCSTGPAQDGAKMMLEINSESALPSIALGCAVWLGMELTRVSNPRPQKCKSIIGIGSPSATRGIGFLGNKRECQILPPPSAGEFLPGSAHRRW